MEIIVGVSDHYQFRVQKVFVGSERRFQLRVGMVGERDLDFIPVHQTAFAQRIALQVGHETEEEAHQERDYLLGWLKDPTALVS